MGWLSGWDYRKKITIDSTKIDSALSNFPVLVHLDSGATDFWGHCDSKENVAFTSSDGTTKLKREIERFDHTNDNLDAHVKVPSVSSSADTEIYIYYDSSSPTHGETDDTDTWDANFKLVTHMKDAPDSSHIADSTSNNNDGTKKGAGEPAEADAKIAKGQLFDDYDDWINMGDMGISEGSNWTIEAWIKTPTGTNEVIYAEGNSAGGSNFAILRVYANKAEIVTGNAGETSATSTTSVNDNTWRHLVGRRSGTEIRIFVDGTSEDTDTAKTPDVDRAAIGALYRDSLSDYWDDYIDEVRVSNIDRSAAWIKASYNSGNDTLVSYGGEETGVTTYYATINSNARIKIASIQTITGNARIKKKFTGTITGNATVIFRKYETIGANARVKATQAETITGNARIQIAETYYKTIGANARIKAPIAQTITGVARIKVPTSKTTTGTARIKVLVAKTITGNAWLKKTFARTISGIARIKATPAQTIIGNARILTGVIKELWKSIRIKVDDGRILNKVDSGKIKIIVDATKEED